jgi:peptidyl-prolyl cis-trans isomerase A (cyclophilin A)
MPGSGLAALPVTFALLIGCAAESPAGTRIVMETSAGAIEIEIYTLEAPVTAANFLRLVDGGHMDGATFYRTVSPANDNGSPVISVIQGGRGDAAEPFAPIPHEPTSVTGLRHRDGSVSMARADVGTASTEFFICVGEQPALDFGGLRNPDGQGFAVFGRVVSGMDVVRAIHEAPADAPTEFEYFRGQLLETPVLIRTIRRVSPAGIRPGAASDTGQ